MIGVGLSPRGATARSGIRPTHSPTAFIRDLGAAYRASGRKRPLMDAFAIHPYMLSSAIPPTAAHPKTTQITLADYPKLVTLLDEAFRGTPQRGRTLPILYTEFGVQTTVPQSKLASYQSSTATRARPRQPRAPGRLLPQGAGARLLPADREGPVRLPHVRRDPPRRLAVGPLLRRPHAPSRALFLSAGRSPTLRGGKLTGCGR